MTERSCDRCTATRTNGQRCKLRTCTTGPYCWIHTLHLNHLRVKPSRIHGAGMGLFAEHPGTTNPNKLMFAPKPKTAAKTRELEQQGVKFVITEYTGDRIDEIQKDQLARAKKDAYIFRVNKNVYINPGKSNQGIGRYANDCRRSRFKCNARFKLDARKGTVHIVPKTKIYNGDEILVSYGTGYWNATS